MWKEEKKMIKCKRCGALSRVNYPHGRKSKPMITFIIRHDKKCSLNKEEKNVKKI